MKKLIDYIFPFKLHLNILQLEEYKPVRFIRWISKNSFKRNIPAKKKLVYTPKVKNIIVIALALTLLFPLLIFIVTQNFLFAFLIFLLLFVNPFIALSVSVILIKPYEIYNRKVTIEKIRNKIASFNNLKIIAITGSFGKSSTKEILYQIIKTKYRTLRTPESFNTIFGVSKVVDLELDSSYQYFICEMAAYKIGEIKELVFMVPPDYGILTGITTQHFERFGSLKNTIRAKFELVDAIRLKENIIFNLNDQNVFEEVRKRKINKPQRFLKAENVSFNKNGSSFELIMKDKSYKINTSLFGFANIKNILGAGSMALKLGIEPEEIAKALNNLKPFDNRLVLINTKGKTTMVNNTYSSNPQGFKETLETAKVVKGKKVLITPGLVELGSLEETIHRELGELARGVFDKVILVGRNQRTKSFSEGLIDGFDFINDERKEYFEKIEKLKGKYDWIFMENDVTENY